MSLQKVESVPVIKAEDLHEFLQVTEKFAVWLDNLINDERFIPLYDYWVYNDQLHLGMFAAKQLSLDTNTDQGRKAYDHFSGFAELRGSYQILSTREAFPTSNSIQSPVEPTKLRAV